MFWKKIMRKEAGKGGLQAVLKIALPLILSSSCHAVNMFMDRLMLAHHSQEAVAAAFTGGLTNFTLSCLFVGTIGYTGTFVAQYEGALRRDRIGSVVWQGIYLALIGGLCMGTGIFWAAPLFNCFGHSPAVTLEEIKYFEILSKGAFIFLLSNAVLSFWTGRGKTDLVLAVSILVTLLNLPLNYILIFGKLGFPAMGASGAAWGTVLSELAGLVIYLVLFFAPSAHRVFQTGNARINFPLLGRMLRYGLPSGIHLALDLISFNVFSLLLGCYGPAVHEASSITFGINNIAFCPVMGIGMTAAILVGQGVGAEDIPLARKSVRSCMILVQGYTLLMVILFTCCQSLVLAPFVRIGDESQIEVMRHARLMLYLISAWLFFDGVNITLSNAIRGAGDTKFPMWTIAVCGVGFFAIPCWIFFFFGMPWWTLWLMMVLEIVLLCFIFTFRYLGAKWTHMRVIDVAAVKEVETLEDLDSVN